MRKYFHYLPYLLFSLSLFGMVGSLYASEIMKLPPCVLCWYLRIAMYPMVAISAVGILLKDKNLGLYLIPFAVSGFVISLYHNLLYYHILPEAIAPCVQGVSCTERLVNVFGFIDIPQGAFILFTLILICTIILMKFNKKK